MLTLTLRSGRPPATVPLLGRPGTGRVLWARDDSAWLRLPDGVVGLAPPSAPLGPRWVQRAEPWPSLAEGDAVVVEREGLCGPGGTLFLEHRHAVGWLGPLPDAAALSGAAARALLSDALSSCRASDLADAPWRARVEPAVAAIGRLAPLDALKVAVNALGGLGPGLTPSGDDMLSGILFAFRALGGPTVEPALVSVARSVRTNDPVAFRQARPRFGPLHPARSERRARRRQSDHPVRQSEPGRVVPGPQHTPGTRTAQQRHCRRRAAGATNQGREIFRSRANNAERKHSTGATATPAPT